MRDFESVTVVTYETEVVQPEETYVEVVEPAYIAPIVFDIPDHYVNTGIIDLPYDFHDPIVYDIPDQYVSSYGYGSSFYGSPYYGAR